MELSLHAFTHSWDAMALGGISSLYINTGSVLELSILIALENSLHSSKKEKKKREKRKEKTRKIKRKETKKSKKGETLHPFTVRTCGGFVWCLHERCLCSCFMFREGKSRNINCVG